MMDEATSVMDLMQQGGWVMWALLAFSVVSLAVIVERTWMLYRHRTDTGAFLKALGRALDRGSVAAAIRLCEETRGPVAVVIKAGLLRFGKPREQMEQVMEAAARVEVRRLQRRLVILATTANLAPLLGFFGTVTGMMASFAALAEFSFSQPGMVAAGIEEALTTTAAGLGVAIPVQLAYNLLQNRIVGLVGDMETAADLVLDIAGFGHSASSVVTSE